MKLFIGFGFVCLFVLYSITNRIFLYLEAPTANYSINHNLETLKNQTKHLVRYSSVFEHYALTLKKRVVITKRELYDTAYQNWREFVDKILSTLKDWNSISLENRIIFEKTDLLTDKLKDMLTPRSGESKIQFDKRFIFSVPNFIREYKDILSRWVRLLSLNTKLSSDNQNLIDEANLQINVYNDLIEKNGEGWSLNEKAINYLIPSLLSFAPSVMAFGPIIGGIVGTAGPLLSGIYHLLDTYKYKPETNMVLNTVQVKFSSSTDVLEKMSGFMSDNIASITNMIEKIEELETTLEITEGDIIREEFLNVVMIQAESLSKYNDNITSKHKISN